MTRKCYFCNLSLKGRQRRWCSHLCEVRNWQKVNKEKANQYKKNYIINHPERRKLSLKKYDSLERVIARRKIWVEANRERLNEQARVNSKKYRDRLASQRHKRRAIVKKLKKHFTKIEWIELKGKYDFTCLRCKKREPEILLTPDHIVPLLRGGSNTIDNIQPLCGKCNRWKSIKIIDFRVDFKRKSGKKGL